ncbi:MAG: peptidoglycan DD-metalloendopeptidase family protein [Lachnospiraceae bacterium]|nr:peptidoglycan DD-metalloendopeptidase family protein [Lachnospiraceae bacterium]
MEKKDLKGKWNFKNNKVVFSLCLLGVVAFSSLFAMNQVKQAEKEKNQLLNEQAALEQQEDSFSPQVDEAVRDVLENQEEEPLEAALNQEEMSELEASASGEITAELEQQAEMEAAEDAQEASAAGEETVLEAQTAEILPTVSFADSDSLTWPVAGSVVLDYSMDGSIYFPTLQQYKYNPALIIGSDEGAQVVAAARGIVESIGIDEETGTTVTMSLGNGYELKYGQLQELAVAEGDVVEQGQLIGYVSAPTKYYCVEGTNLFFEMTKDEAPVDPVLYLE